MSETLKLGIIICDRYVRCAGGKCLRSLKRREGAFAIYESKEIELVGFTTCDGCPGGNVEYAGDEMVRNGAQVIHLATGMIVGYPPCPYIESFKNFLELRYHIQVVMGTHPIPEKYLQMHKKLKSWEQPCWEPWIEPTITDEATRTAYN